MKKREIEILAYIASEKYQKKYVDGATVEIHALPGELVEDLLSTLERVIVYSKDKNKDRILNLYVYCQKLCDQMPHNKYKSKQWPNMMAAVRNYLIHIEKFNIEKWEKKI